MKRTLLSFECTLCRQSTILCSYMNMYTHGAPPPAICARHSARFGQPHPLRRTLPLSDSLPTFSVATASAALLLRLSPQPLTEELMITVFHYICLDSAPATIWRLWSSPHTIVHITRVVISQSAPAKITEYLNKKCTDPCFYVFLFIQYRN